MFSHLSDEKLSRLTAGELGSAQRLFARAHLEKCWQCRLRRESLERSALQLAEYRNRLVERIPNNPDRRASLLKLMRQRSEAATLPHASGRAFFSIAGKTHTLMNPILVSFFIVVVAAVLLVTVWRRPVVTVSAAELLGRAESGDRALLDGKSGVIYEKISIHTAKGTTEHEIYRDAHRVRQRRASVTEAEIPVPLQSVLVTAHVALDDPFSIASYRAWHDGEEARTDTVSQSGNGLLTLSTVVPDGNIRQETLTVRASDFHPIKRTVRTADEDVIEIAELNYAFLDWSGVNEALFEAPPTIPSPAVAALILPTSVLPTAEELDAAELGARLAIHQLHGDEGEQIEVSRTARTIDVHGVVDTEARKLEVNMALHTLPHVKSTVLSIADQLRIDASSGEKSVTVAASGDSDSSLESYLASGAQRHNQDLLNESSRGLLDASLKVRSSSNELLTLRAHFVLMPQGNAAKLAFQELTRSYSERLIAGLDAEATTLGGLGFSAPSQPKERTPARSLAEDVAENNALCLELIAGDAGTGRPADEIVLDIYNSIQEIRSALASSNK